MTDSINVYFTQYNDKVPDLNVNSIINESYFNKHANNALGQILCPLIGQHLHKPRVLSPLRSNVRMEQSGLSNLCL